jgi:DUF917 family protein
MEATTTKYATQRNIMQSAHTIAKTLDCTIKYAKRLGQAIKIAWAKVKAVVKAVFGIYNATFDIFKGKDSVSFEICECQKVGDAFVSVKNSSKKFNVIITDEDDLTLCRKEVNTFLSKEGIDCHNISTFKIK